jgi:hypothetical protein
MQINNAGTESHRHFEKAAIQEQLMQPFAPSTAAPSIYKAGETS